MEQPKVQITQTDEAGKDIMLTLSVKLRWNPFNREEAEQAGKTLQAICSQASEEERSRLLEAFDRAVQSFRAV